MLRRADRRDCGRVQDLLEMWVDGELGGDDVARVRSHLGHCADCRAQLRLVEQIASELRSLPAFDLPHDLARVVGGRMRARPWTRLGAAVTWTAARPLPALAAVAALLTAVAVLASWVGPFRPRYSEQEVARATVETKLALAYVASVTQRAELRVTKTIMEDGAAGRTVRGFHHAIQALDGSPAAATGPSTAPSQRTTVQGS